MTVETATTLLIPAVADQRTAMIPAPQRAGLIASCRAWLRWRNDARALQGLEPHLARETGAVLLQDVLAAAGALAYFGGFLLAIERALERLAY